MTGPLSETSPEEVSARRWFRGTVGAAIGLSVLVSLVTTIIYIFVHGFGRDVRDAAQWTLYVASIVIPHLIFCYPAARFLQKRILLGARGLWAVKGCIIGLLLPLIIVDGYYCLAYIESIGSRLTGGQARTIILYWGPIYVLEILGGCVGALAGWVIEMGLDIVNRKREKQ